jgi:hypothetical protein
VSNRNNAFRNIKDFHSNSEKYEYGIDPKLLDQPVEQHAASEIVSSPFWHPCRFCGYPIVFIYGKPYDAFSAIPRRNNYTQTHKCNGKSRRQYLDHLREVAV